MEDEGIKFTFKDYLQLSTDERRSAVAAGYSLANEFRFTIEHVQCLICGSRVSTLIRYKLDATSDTDRVFSTVKFYCKRLGFDTFYGVPITISIERWFHVPYCFSCEDVESEKEGRERLQALLGLMSFPAPRTEVPESAIIINGKTALKREKT